MIGFINDFLFEYAKAIVSIITIILFFISFYYLTSDENENQRPHAKIDESNQRKKRN